MKHFILFIPLLTLVNSIQAYTYSLILDNEELFKPCEGKKDNFMSEWFDMSNVTFQFVDDNEIIMNGYYRSICRNPNGAIPKGEIRVHKMAGGVYGMPILQIVRMNICTSFFNPKEVWYKIVQNIDPKTRTCPPKYGSIYSFQNFTTKDLKASLPDPNLAGAYRVVIRSAFLDNTCPPICLSVDLHLYKIF